MNPLKAVQDVNKLRREAKKMQEEMKGLSVTGVSRKELVKVTINGLQEIVDINIEDDLLESKDELVKHIKDAFSDAQKKIQKEMSRGMDLNKIKEMMGM